MARVSPVAAETPWAFLAVSGTQHGPPRWMVLEGDNLRATVGVEAVAGRLRDHLRDDPPNVEFDENCERWLDQFLAAAAREETRLLPRRMQRALEQMAEVTRTWGDQALNRGDQTTAQQWWRISRAARHNPETMTASPRTSSARRGGTWSAPSSRTYPGPAAVADTSGCAT